jgi:hypothetical protein
MVEFLHRRVQRMEGEAMEFMNTSYRIFFLSSMDHVYLLSRAISLCTYTMI